MKKVLTNEYVRFCIAAFVLVIICFASIELTGDDWIWYYAYDDEKYQFMRMPNGRYLSNILTYLMERYVPIRFVVYVPVLFLIVCLLCTGLHRKGNDVVMWTGFMLFCLMPANMWDQIVMWISGYPVYTIPVLTVLLYLWLWFSDTEGRKYNSKCLLLGTLVLGAAGALCVEHMTIYSCLLSIFVLLYAKFKKGQRIRAYQVTYFIGTVLGTVLMFTNHNYSSIFSDGDQVGYRSFEFSFSDLFYQMYHNVIPLFAKQFPLIQSLIALSYLILLTKADRSEWKPERKCYVKLTMLCEMLYAFYSVFVNCFVNLENLTPMMRVSALEAAFAFLHLISIVYLAWVLLPRSRFLRVTIYSVSTFLTSAVFCVVNPVSERCFFADYCFWLLCAIELFDSVLALNPRSEIHIRKAAIVFGCAAASFVSYINIVNKVVYRTSISYLQEQSEKGLKHIEILEQPYPTYSPTGTFAGIINSWAVLEPEERDADRWEVYYINCLEKYYGLKFNREEFGYVTIPFYNFNL